MKPTTPTLGQRNNNPLNIRHNPHRLWQGEIPPPKSPLPETGRAGGEAFLPETGKAGGEAFLFCHFQTLEWGIRAAFCILRTYADQHHIYCIRDIITRWAPPTENDTKSYIAALCNLTGFEGEERLQEHQWPTLVTAMAKVESQMHLQTAQVNAAFKLYKTPNQ